MPTIKDVFAEVDKGEVDYGVIPIENSAEGVVFQSLHSFDLLVGSDIKIVSQIYLSIIHNLISNSPLEEIERVYSKDQAIAQCRGWLRRHVSQAETVEASSTSGSGTHCRWRDGSAAIASAQAAKQFGLPIVGESIQDMNNNVTRFLVIGHRDDCPGPVGEGTTRPVSFFPFRTSREPCWNACNPSVTAISTW